jgi:hypothetical protein
MPDAAEQAIIYEQGASERRRVTRSALSSSVLLFSTLEPTGAPAPRESEKKFSGVYDC